MKVEKFIARRIKSLDSVGSRETAAESLRLRKKGVDILRLSGAPFRQPPDHVLEAARKAFCDPVHPPSNGFSALRGSIASKLRKENDIEVDPESQIVVTNGAMHALYIAMTALLDPGDEVLMFSPSFFFYGIVQLMGAVPVYAALNERDGFRFCLAILEKNLSHRTKLLVVNTPANPTGYVATENDLQAIARFARQHDLIVISDESYEKMIYDGARHFSIGSLREASNRIVTVHSFTKSYALPDWRIGYIAAPRELCQHFTKVLEWINLYCNHVAQKAALAALTGPQGWVREIAAEFERYRNIMFDGICRIENLSCVKPQAGPFVFVNVSELSVSPRAFSRCLLSQFGVPSVPGEFFQSTKHIRIPFGAPEPVLIEALHRIECAVREITLKTRRGTKTKADGS